MKWSSSAWLAAVLLGAGLGSSRPAVARPGQSFEEAAAHWAFQPVRAATPPRVRSAERVQTPVDAFLLASLEERGTGFAPPADRRTLLRRLSYDLIGLPPTYEEVEAFCRDESSEAVERVVDRLLADPRYGERWGRHWLDVARYADTKDLVLLYGRDALRPYAYTYRDYVVRAFNEDLPYDQFVRDQLAADLEEPGVPGWRLAALGFLTLGRLFDNNPHDRIDDQIDTVSRGLLGLTVACARCHDHKYDAVTMEDYYGWYGVFAATEQPYVLPLIEDPASVPGGLEFEARLAGARQELERHLDAEFGQLTETLRERLGAYLLRAATTQPDFSETTQFFLSLTPEDFRPALVQRTRRFLAQRVRPDDRVFGLWASLRDLSADDYAGQAAEVIRRVQADPDRRAQANALVDAAFAGSAPASFADVVKRYGEVLGDVYRSWRHRECAETAYLMTPEERELLEVVRGSDGPVWFPYRDTPLHLSRPASDRYGRLVLNLDKLAAQASNAPPARAMVVRDLPEPRKPRIFLRGNPTQPGPEVPRAFLRVLSGGRVRPLGPGSGRLALARAIATPENPLTARVWVNRVWMHHFGEPLVGTPADFGARSEAPSHPELLDWLAREFMRSGWRLKPLHRLIVLSAAYQQGSASGDAASGALDGTFASASGAGSSSGGQAFMDPENRWLSHYPRRRLDLESMRDSLLFVSGRLDSTLGGRPVDVAGDPLNRRRTLYGIVDRQNLPGLYRSFDFAIPDQCVERRPRTTVPQQALFSLNSPFVLEQARAVADAVASVAGNDSEARVADLYRRVFGRDPRPAEVGGALRYVDSASADAPEQMTAWAQLAQILMVSNEAVFLD